MRTSAAVDGQQFRAALGAFTTGVTIVTTVDRAGRDVGLTANSFNSVSLEPPMVLWSLAKSALSLPVFAEAAHFAVHVLAWDQEPLSNLFARRGADKFRGLELERGIDCIPLIGGCAARFQCRTAFQYAGGDHTIFVGEVLTLDHFERPPLVFQGGRYAISAKKSGALSSNTSAALQDEGTFGEDFLGYLLGRAHYQLFGRLKAQLARHELTGEEYFVLATLGVREGRTVEQIHDLLDYTGVCAAPALLGELAARGFVTLQGCLDRQTRVWLTQKGKRSIIELTAAAKAVEADAQTEFDFSEAQMLKHLLKRLIRATDPGLPDLWQAQAPE